MSTGGGQEDRLSGPKIIIPKLAVREKGAISIKLHTKQFQQPPNTIALSELIDKSCQKIYNSLENSLDLLVKSPNTEKKRSLLMNLNWIKEVLTKIYILSLDASHSRRLLAAMDMCQEIFAFQSKLFNVPDSLYGIYIENSKLLQPSYDISGALSLLTNQQLPFPTAIKPPSEPLASSTNFEEFLGRKIHIQSVAFEIFEKFNFQLKITNGILEVHLDSAFSASFSYHVVGKKWILLQVNYLFLSSLKEENFAILLGNKINSFAQFNKADEFMQIYFSLYCIIYFGQLMKLKMFAENSNITLARNYDDSLSMKILIWPDFEDCFVTVTLPQFETNFNSSSVIAELCEGVLKFPLIEIQTTFQGPLFAFLNQNLTDFYQYCREKATTQRLTQVQYFLPDFFCISLDKYFALVSCFCSNFVLILNDANGAFILTQQESNLLQKWEFNNVNDLSEGIVSIFLDRVTEIVLGELCKASHVAYLAEDDGNAVIDEICGIQFNTKISKNGIMVLYDNSPLLSFEAFDFNFDKYSNSVHLKVEEFFSSELQKLSVNLCFFSELTFQGNLLTGKMGILDVFHSSFVSILNESFYIPISSVYQLNTVLPVVTIADHFISFMQTVLPHIPIICHVFTVNFTIDLCSFEIDFLNEEIFIKEEMEIAFCNILWSLLKNEKYADFFDFLKTVAVIKQQLQPNHLKRLHSSFGDFIIGLFDNFSFKISFFPSGQVLLSLYKKDPQFESLFKAGYTGRQISVSSLNEAFDFYFKSDSLISKYIWLTNELQEIIGADKIKRTSISVEFTFNSFACMFCLTEDKIAFTQIFLTDPAGRAFSGWVESEIAKCENMKALIISLLHLIRTTPNFLADFCRLIMNFESNPQITCYIPLVLPSSYSTSNTSTQHTIIFHSNTKSLTLFLIFQLTKTKKYLPLFLSYSLESNTVSIPDKYRGALENYQPLIEDVCKGREHKNVQINNYIEMIKQKLISK